MLAEDIGEMLRGRRLTIAVAESCTGGRLGDLITDVPGSSDYFLGGVISYSNDAKIRLLGVKKSTLVTKGAVSREIAIQMADGARKALRADIGVGITGIAGPAGSTPNKPVGLVYIAVSSEAGAVSERYLFKGPRRNVKEQAAEKALRMIDEFLRSSR